MLRTLRTFAASRSRHCESNLINLPEGDTSYDRPTICGLWSGLLGSFSNCRVARGDREQNASPSITARFRKRRK